MKINNYNRNIQRSVFSVSYKKKQKEKERLQLLVIVDFQLLLASRGGIRDVELQK